MCLESGMPASYESCVVVLIGMSTYLSLSLSLSLSLCLSLSLSVSLSLCRSL